MEQYILSAFDLILCCPLTAAIITESHNDLTVLFGFSDSKDASTCSHALSSHKIAHKLLTQSISSSIDVSFTQLLQNVSLLALKTQLNEVDRMLLISYLLLKTLTIVVIIRSSDTSLMFQASDIPSRLTFILKLNDNSLNSNSIQTITFDNSTIGYLVKRKSDQQYLIYSKGNGLVNCNTSIINNLIENNFKWKNFDYVLFFESKKKYLTWLKTLSCEKSTSKFSIQRTPLDSPLPPLPEILNKGTVIGTVNKSLIALGYNNNLLLIDQHAAHERIRLEKLISAVISCLPASLYPNSSQKLSEIHDHFLGDLNDHSLYALYSSTPEQDITLKREAKHNILVNENVKLVMGRWGWKYLVAVSTVIIKTFPIILGKSMVHTFDHWLVEIDFLLKNCNYFVLPVMKVVNSCACRGSVFFNETLNSTALDTITSDLARCISPYCCAHGRPLAVVIPLEEGL
ncbi:hypothetical protein RCL1_001155 [Eukaryota sp. TZLM3-RCL]